jgi:hypothetical protein
MRLALIDGDVVRYQVGYATQHKDYSIDGKVFITKKEAADYCADLGIPEHLIVEDTIPDFIQAVYHTVDKFIENVVTSAKADDYKILLTGEGNYRELEATIRPYKGQRSSEKPLNFYKISEYLKRKHGALTVDGMEADDALGIEQYGVKGDQESWDSSVICTIDKDLDMIPGYHYNWNKDLLYFVTEDNAICNFYRQLLKGDSVDNIEGCPGVGEKRAHKLITSDLSELEMYRRVQLEYVNVMRKTAEKFDLACKHNEECLFESAMRDLNENAMLLWIQRERGVRWAPPTGYRRRV